MSIKEEVTNRLGGFRESLSIEERDGFIIVKSTKWLSEEDYAKISRILEEFRGERVKAGKNSHWRIPLVKQDFSPNLHNAEPHVITVCPHCGKDIYVKVEKR